MSSCKQRTQNTIGFVFVHFTHRDQFGVSHHIVKSPNMRLLDGRTLPSESMDPPSITSDAEAEDLQAEWKELELYLFMQLH